MTTSRSSRKSNAKARVRGLVPADRARRREAINASAHDELVNTASERALEAAPTRALTFLRAVGSVREIRQLLGTIGYTVADHHEGWRYLLTSSGYDAKEREPLEDAGSRDAVAALDDWDEAGLRIVRLSLERRYPVIAKRLLTGLSASRGAAAISGVRELLDRLDALEARTDGDSIAATKLLGKRGLNRAERIRLRALVGLAERSRQGGHQRAAVARREQERRARQSAALEQLHAWVSEWAGIARVLLRRRDYRTRLGLTERRVARDLSSGGGP